MTLVQRHLDRWKRQTNKRKNTIQYLLSSLRLRTLIKETQNF